jgi:hypoxanthine-DNA glycosylase
LPGERSLRDGRYYAHPTNQFWKLVGAVIGEDLPRLAYDARLQRLAAHGIGLWDVVGAARRAGSADNAIRDALPNPIGGLAADYPKLRAIAFNGGHAAATGRRLMAGVEGVALIDLPSSSGLARASLDSKIAAWSALRPYLVTRP